MPMASSGRLVSKKTHDVMNDENASKKNMKKVTVCVAAGCDSQSGRDPVSFFSFPSNKNLRVKWVRQLRRGTGYVPTQHSRICCKHFEDSEFVNPERHESEIPCNQCRLKHTALPRMFKHSRPKGAKTFFRKSTAKSRKNKALKKSTVSRNSYVLTQSPWYDSDHTYSILSGYIGPNEPSPDYLWKFDAVICDFLREQGIPGAALFMTYKGKPVYQQGYGVNDCGVPMSSSSHLRIASISKVFTAIAILRLCDEGRLQLDQLVFGEKGILERIQPCKKLSSVQEYRSITVRHLLEHSAGWDRDRDGDHVFWYADDKHAANIDADDDEQLLRYVLTKRLSFTPGTKHAYSNLGYLVLGFIVEHITGMNYEDYVKSILLELDIEDIYVGKATQDKVHYMETKYYNNSDPAVKKSVYDSQKYVPTQYGSFPMETSASYGGWVTCARNLVMILDHLCYEAGDHCILSKNSIEEMFKAPQFAQGDAWYGLGIDLEEDGQGFGHTGAMDGTSTTVHHSANGYTWALLLNAWAKDTDLDGMIKYALSAVRNTIYVFNDLENGSKDCDNHMKLENRDCEQTLLLQESDKGRQSAVYTYRCPNSELQEYSRNTYHKQMNEYFLISDDRQECVQILLPHDQFLSHVKEMKDRGYVIHNVNVLSLTNEVLFNIIWRKHEVNSVDWFVLLDIEWRNLHKHIKSFKKCWQIVNIQNYVKEKQIMHLFVIEEHLDSLYEQKLHFMINIAEHKTMMAEYKVQGYQLKLQCFLWYECNTHISIVFERVNSDNINYKLKTYIWYDLSIEDYAIELGEKVRKGMYLEDWLVYSTDDLPRVGAVWKKGHVNKDLENNVFQRHDVSKYGFLFEMRETMADNLPVQFISAYVNEDVIYFAAVWEIVSRKSGTKKSEEPLIQCENAGMLEFQESLCGI